MSLKWFRKKKPTKMYRGRKKRQIRQSLLYKVGGRL